jgi:hypothetical protein
MFEIARLLCCFTRKQLDAVDSAPVIQAGPFWLSTAFSTAVENSWSSTRARDFGHRSYTSIPHPSVDILPAANEWGTSVSERRAQAQDGFHISHNAFPKGKRPLSGFREKPTDFAHIVHRTIHRLCINRPVAGNNHVCNFAVVKDSFVCDFHNIRATARTAITDGVSLQDGFHAPGG